MQTYWWLLSSWRHTWNGLYPMWAQDMESYDPHPNPFYCKVLKAENCGWGCMRKTWVPKAHLPIHQRTSARVSSRRGRIAHPLGKLEIFLKSILARETHTPNLSLSHSWPKSPYAQQQKEPRIKYDCEDKFSHIILMTFLAFVDLLNWFLWTDMEVTFL